MRSAIAAAVLGVALLAPSTALGDSGCGNKIETALPTGTIFTTACGYADGSLAQGQMILKTDISARWRYTRCAVHVAMEVGGRVFRTSANCDLAFQRPGIPRSYVLNRPNSGCVHPITFRVWGHVSVAYLHTQVITTPTASWDLGSCLPD